MNKDAFDNVFGVLLDGYKFHFENIDNCRREEVFLLILWKIVSILKLQTLSFFKKAIDITNKNLIFCITNNQARSVQPLHNKDNLIVRPYLDSSHLPNVWAIYCSPLSQIHNLFKIYKWVGAFSIPILSRLYISISYFYYCDVFYYLFKSRKPNSITITNPSNVILRAAVYAATELGIKTIYLPHAHPSRLYPKIRTDFALLEGIDGLNYYSFKEGIKLFLVGSVRLDPFKSLKPELHNGINILVTTNLLDDMEKVYTFIQELLHNCNFLDFRIILRPHPNQTLDYERWNQLSSLEFSDSKVEESYEALRRSDILIAGNSTIFFEAVYFPIKCYYKDFLKDEVVKDSYELSSYAFIRRLVDISDISIDGNDNHKDIGRIDYSYGKGRSSFEMISDIYNKYLYNKS